MYFGKEMYPYLVIFVLGGIITAIYLQKSLNGNVQLSRGMFTQKLAVKEEFYLYKKREMKRRCDFTGEESRIQGHTIRPRKLPCQHEETH